MLCEYKECFSHDMVQEHHIVKRGQAKFLINCRLNSKHLCWEHHHGTNGVHGKNGKQIDLELKKDFQLMLQDLFREKEFYTEEEIKEVLQIKEKDVKMLTRLLQYDIRGYPKETIIRACMGGKLVI